MTRTKSLPSLLKKLTGGDRRQIGQSNTVVADVLKDPSLFPVLFSGLTSDDPLVRMRSADASEKVTRERPALLVPHKRALLRILESTEEQEVAWHSSVMAPRIALTKRERIRVYNALTSFLEAHSRIQRVMALQGLVDLAEQDRTMVGPAAKAVNAALQAEAPSVRARARKLANRLKVLEEP